MTEPTWERGPLPDAVSIRYGAHDSGNATMPEVFYDSGPVPVAVVPRWWFTTDKRTMDRLTFLPDYAYQGDAIVVGMRVAWEGGEMELCADHITGEYFRRSAHHGRTYGRVFAPAPPPVGLWSGEGPAW